MRRVWKRAQPKPEKKFRVNERIRVPQVFLIDEDGENVGVVSTREALERAIEAEMDLVEVNPSIDPPVAKIMDYGQFKYKLDKKSQKAKSKQKKAETKEIRLTVRINAHDFNFRLEQAKKFLEKGSKLKIDLLLKGRERQHPEKAVEIIEKFVNELKLADNIELDQEQGLTRQGGRFNIVLINKKG